MVEQPIMTVEAVREFLARALPQISGIYAVETVSPLRSCVRSFVNKGQVRPGGTIWGPTMMELADVSLYAAILGSIGPVDLAVTTHLACNFLRRPQPVDLIAECQLLKLGKRLAVGEVTIRSDCATDLVAHATGTYSIPTLDKRGR